VEKKKIAVLIAQHHSKKAETPQCYIKTHWQSFLLRSHQKCY